MKINGNNSISFQSRNSTIRFADDIARNINKVYPRISASKFESFKSAKKFGNYINKLWDKNEALRNIIEIKENKAISSQERIKSVISTIESMKRGNCAESTYLAYIAAKINGIKEPKFAYLTTPNEYDLDHSVLLIEDKKPYVIDAWLGFADYVPNAIKRYQKEYRQCFNFKNAKTEKILIKREPYLIYYASVQKFFSDKDLDFVTKTFPDLKLKKRNQSNSL